jgi:hypothetical protein
VEHVAMKVGQPFNPRKTFLGLFIPEGLASSPAFSSTSKLAYGHLVRRSGAQGRCWPSYSDIARHIGVQERAAQRALKELQTGPPPLIRSSARTDANGRQTSNEFLFLWCDLFEGVKSDTPVENDALPPVEFDTPVDVKNDAPVGVKNDTQKEKEEKSKRKEKTTTPTALQLALSDYDYQEFLVQCGRQRLPVPDRQTAIAIRQRFPETFNGRPAWLQLRAFPGQKSARLWLAIDRDQALLELARQELTPPKPSDRELARSAARERFIQGD